MKQIIFNGCGWFFNYFLGIAKVLQDKFNLDDCIFIGFSGGCFPAIVLGAELNPEDAMFRSKETSFLLSQDPFGAFSMNSYEYLENVVKKEITMDSLEKMKNRTFISMTELPYFKNVTLSSWDSPEDLAKCACASCFIPILLSPKFYYEYRGKKMIDGCLSYSSIVSEDTNTLEFSVNLFDFNLYTYLCPSSSVRKTKNLYKMGIQFAEDNIDELAKVLDYKKISST